MRIVNHTHTDTLRPHDGKDCRLIKQLGTELVDYESWPMFCVEIGSERVVVFLDELEPRPSNWNKHPTA